MLMLLGLMTTRFFFEIKAYLLTYLLCVSWLYCLCRSNEGSVTLQQCLQFSWRHRIFHSRHQFRCNVSVHVQSTMTCTKNSTVT